MKTKTFIEQCLAGEAKADEIDNAIDHWHDGDSPLELYEFLGMTLDEYAKWIKNPGYLNQLISSKQAA
jgi:hypothetical protein